MNEIAVKATNLTKTYGEGDTEVDALKDASFEIPRGEAKQRFSTKSEPLNHQLQVKWSRMVSSSTDSTTTAAPNTGSSQLDSYFSSTTLSRRLPPTKTSL